MYPTSSEKLSSVFPPNKVQLPHVTWNPTQLLYTKTITLKLKNKILHYNLPSCFCLLFAGHHSTKNTSSYSNHINKQVKSGKLQFLNQHVGTFISWN